MTLNRIRWLNRYIHDNLGSLKVKKYLHSSKIIRCIREGDLERVLELYREGFNNNNYNQIIEYSRLFRNIFFVYELDGLIVGYLGFYVHLKFIGMNRIQIATAFSGAVDEKVRGKGIFTTLYRESLAELRNNNVNAVYGYIDVNNKNSLSIHNQLGFKIIATLKEVCGAENCYKVELIFNN